MCVCVFCFKGFERKTKTIMGANRCSRKRVNNKEGPKILPMNQSKCL